MVILQLPFRIPSVEISSPIFNKIGTSSVSGALQIKEVIDIWVLYQFGGAAIWGD
jgi:hypothetical protein